MFILRSNSNNVLGDYRAHKNKMIDSNVTRNSRKEMRILFGTCATHSDILLFKRNWDYLEMYLVTLEQLQHSL